MTAQMKDPFIWNQKKWTFIGADDVYSLFDPQKYGLTPTMANTACYKGFIIQFAVIDNSLFLKDYLFVVKIIFTRQSMVLTLHPEIMK